MRIIFSLLSVFFAFPLLAQINISGKVVDKTNQNPLVGASVFSPTTKQGTVTDADGIFSLKLDAVYIEISYLGYKKVAISNLVDGQELNIEMDATSDLVIDILPEIIAPATPVEFNTPAPIMKIPRQHLERDNEVSITSSLNRIPGVYMQSGALNTNRITIRGIGNRSLFSTAKIRAYLDEIPLTSGIGETTIEDIDLSLIEEIEVWKGPTASTYGAGLGGLIKLNSVNTKKDGLASSLSIANTFGSYRLRRSVANFQYVNPQQTSILTFNYNNTHSDGYRENNTYDREAFSLLGKVQTGEKNSFTLFTNYTSLKAFIPSSLNRDDYENEPTKAAFTWGRVMGFEDADKMIVGVSNHHDFVNKTNVKFSNSTSVFGSYRHAYELRPFNILRENSIVTGGRTKFTYEGKLNDKNEIEVNAGMEIFREEYDWQIFNVDQRDSLMGDNMETRTYANFFLEGDLALSSKLNFIAGLNYNTTNYSYTDLFLLDGQDQSGEYKFDPILSPRLSLSYRPITKMLLFATASHGFSPPTLEETLTPDGTINPDIRPEQGWNFEIGGRGRHLFGGRFIYEFTLYSMQIKDLLVARRTAADQFIGINAGKTDHTGLEAFIQYRVLKFPHNLDFYLSYQYANYTFDDFVDGDNDYSGNDLTGQPPHVVTAGLDFRPYQKGFYGNINFQYVAAFPMRDNNTVSSDAYSVVNLKFGYQKAFAKNWEVDWNVGINNLFDETYAGMILINAGSFGGNAPRYYYPGLPRNYYGGVRVRYKFE